MSRIIVLIIALSIDATHASFGTPQITPSSDIDAQGCSLSINAAMSTAQSAAVDRAVERINTTLLRPAAARTAACIDNLLNLPSIFVAMDPLGFLTGLINQKIDRFCGQVANRWQSLTRPIYDVKLPQIPGVLQANLSQTGGPLVPSVIGQSVPNISDQNWWQRMRANINAFLNP